MIVFGIVFSQNSFGQKKSLDLSPNELEKKISSKISKDERVLVLKDLDEESKASFEKSGNLQGPGFVCGKFDDSEYSCGVLTVSKKKAPKAAQRFVFIKNIGGKKASLQLIEDFRKDKALRTNVFLTLQKKSLLKNRGERVEEVDMPVDGVSRTIEGQSNLVIFYKDKDLMKVWTSD